MTATDEQLCLVCLALGAGSDLEDKYSVRGTAGVTSAGIYRASCASARPTRRTERRTWTAARTGDVVSGLSRLPAVAGASNLERAVAAASVRPPILGIHHHSRCINGGSLSRRPRCGGHRACAVRLCEDGVLTRASWVLGVTEKGRRGSTAPPIAIRQNRKRNLSGRPADFGWRA